MKDRTLKVVLLSLVLVLGMQGVSVAKVVRLYTGQLNMNTASAADMTRLPGVGEIIAFRIVKAREKRGQFHKLAELKEVKGVSERMYEGFGSYISLEGANTLHVHMDLNTVTKPLLLGIPGMSEGEADSILNYRKTLKRYVKREDLLKVPGIDGKRYAELCEWLTVAP